MPLDTTWKIVTKKQKKLFANFCKNQVFFVLYQQLCRTDPTCACPAAVKSCLQRHRRGHYLRRLWSRCKSSNQHVDSTFLNIQGRSRKKIKIYLIGIPVMTSWSAQCILPKIIFMSPCHYQTLLRTRTTDPWTDPDRGRVIFCHSTIFFKAISFSTSADNDNKITVQA